MYGMISWGCFGGWVFLVKISSQNFSICFFGGLFPGLGSVWSNIMEQMDEAAKMLL